MGWNGVENGELLELAAVHGFDALITTDKGMEYQHNHQTLPCSVIVLSTNTNTINSLKLLVPALLLCLESVQPRSFTKIALPTTN
jgi:hypothetical protein